MSNVLGEMTPLVFVIVLNWNGKHHLDDCLGSLSAIDYQNYKILLVDNNSRDDSVSFVKSYYQDVLILENGTNLGFAEGNNVGIRYALSHGAEYVVLLNNDTRVEPDFLSHLIRRGEEKKDIGVLGGKVLMFFNPLIVNSTGVNLNRFAYGWDRDFGEDALMVNRAGGEVLAVTGCLMAVKREVFERIGLLDREFFAYFEDVDFCIRVWKNTDFRVEYVPASVIYHKFSASSLGNSLLKRRLMIRNQYRVFFKHFPAKEIAGIFPSFTSHRLRVLLGDLMRHDFSLFFVEASLLLKHWLLFPFTLFNRILEYRGGLDVSFFRDRIVPEMNVPSLRAYSPGYEEIFLGKDKLGETTIHNRIVMGINDEVLGTGWSKLLEEFPRLRRIRNKAVCYLRNERGFEFLQVHGLWNVMTHTSFLEISVEGEMVYCEEIVRGWHTYIVPFENRFPEGAVEVLIEVKDSARAPGTGSGFGINEIGLLPLGSPLLRRMAE